MGKILSSMFWTNPHSESPLSFEIPEKKWFHLRYLLIKGERAYNLGVDCGTCEFLFERLAGTSNHETPRMLTAEMAQGLTQVDKQMIEKLAPIIPEGKYSVSLQTIKPTQVILGSDNDYFAKESGFMGDQWVLGVTALPQSQVLSRAYCAIVGKRDVV